MSKFAYIIIKVEHDAPNTELIARECHWDIEHETIIDANKFKPVSSILIIYTMRDIWKIIREMI